MKIHELRTLREKRHIFTDRLDAGASLGRMLQDEYEHIRDGFVLAIPRGGVPVGIKVSEALALPFDLAIVRKLQIPGNPEAGFGAMTLDETVFLNRPLVEGLGLTLKQIEGEKKRIRAELGKSNALFRGERPFPDLAGKTVILVDDGLASGYTMLACIHMAKKLEVRETVVAVPTAPLRSIEMLEPEADAIYCANIRTAAFFAVAEAYMHWRDLGDEEVAQLLARTT